MSSSIYIPHHIPLLNGDSISLPPSKSIAARMLILRALQDSFTIPDTYAPATLPEDLYHLSVALSLSRQSSTQVISVGESGTAMRFMLAYLCAKPCTEDIRLEGEGRQHQRPIAPLVDALRSLGARIDYIEQEGYPPLLIHPCRLTAQSIELDASESSQYLSALLLIAPLVTGEQEYKIKLLKEGNLASAPYVEITRSCMRQEGFIWQQTGDVFSYTSEETKSTERLEDMFVEGDWTAVSYVYLLSLLSQYSGVGSTSSLYVKNMSLPSIQGDCQVLVDIARRLGVDTERDSKGIRLISHRGRLLPSNMELDCYDTPDLVPTLVAMLLTLKIPFTLRRVAHLRLKESDRLMALVQECSKIGFDLIEGEQTLSWDGTRREYPQGAPIRLETYGDHRIAMALAPLFASLHQGGVEVQNPEVVKKSFPSYWSLLTSVGYRINN